MTIRITPNDDTTTTYVQTDYHLNAQNPDITSEVVPSAAIRLNGLNTFQNSYLQDEEVRTAIRIQD